MFLQEAGEMQQAQIRANTTDFPSTPEFSKLRLGVMAKDLPLSSKSKSRGNV